MLSDKIIMKVLANGLVFLGLRVPDVSTVSLQLFYNVGSKHEQSGERGLAHLLEHMIFKGIKLHPEGYINQTAQTLSASLNATTSYDRTCYFFNAPKEHWQPFLTILADCMSNCTFPQECLNSEMKAVIQELKMYKDAHTRILMQEMISTIFSDHPYHYPVIGFKQDLWHITRERLIKFYKEHYIPNNAVLVVVGDVDMDQVYQYVEQQFGSIPANPDYKQQERYHSANIVQRSVTIHQNVQQPLLMYAFELPKPTLAQNVQAELLSDILTADKTGRLYKKLVEQKMIATSVKSYYYELYDHGILFFVITPTSEMKDCSIEQEIATTLEDIIKDGLSQHELQRIAPSLRSTLFDTLQNPYALGSIIGEGFLQTANKDYLFDFLNYPLSTISKEIQDLIKNYCRPSLMHTGRLLALKEQEVPFWEELQKLSDAEDTKVLSAVTRPVEQHNSKKENTSVVIPAPTDFVLPAIKKTELCSGATLFEIKKTLIPKIMVVIDCKASSYYEPVGKEGLSHFLKLMLHEGTQRYPDTQFVEYLESKGMKITISPYTISLSMLKEDFKEGLSLLNELLTNAMLPEHALERIKAQLQKNVLHFLDSPTDIAKDLANKTIYAGTPLENNRVGSKESIASITLQDIKKAYKEFIVPDKARIVVVGDIEGYEVTKEINKAFSSWKGKAPQRPDVGPISIPTTSKEIKHHINRDQVSLSFCTPSITRHDKKYFSLLLFDQALGNGLLGSMNNKLFKLREQTGLFYTIGGSLTNGSKEYPGMLYVSTIVSNDRLEEARQEIQRVLNAKTITLSDEELKKAVNAILRFYTKGFDTLISTASTTLLCDDFGLDTIEQKINNLKNMTPQHVLEDVGDILSQPLITILVGRL